MISAEDTIIIIKTIVEYIYRIYINLLIIYIQDRFLDKYYSPIQYEHPFFISDEQDEIDEYLAESLKNSTYDIILKLCNIDKTIKRYNKKKFEGEGIVIIKSFLFNLETINEYKIVNNYQFTNKLVMVYKLYNSLNTKTIKSLTFYEYNYIYILYRTCKGDIKVKIVDLTNNYNIINNTIMPFDIITLH